MCHLTNIVKKDRFGGLFYILQIPKGAKKMLFTETAADRMYAKNVPAGVREFIDMKSVSAPRRKPVREHGSKAECDENG